MFDKEFTDLMCDAIQLKDLDKLDPNELIPIDIAQFLDPETKAIMRFVAWYKELLKHDMVYLKAQISLLNDDTTIDKEHNSQKNLEDIMFYKGALNALKRVSNTIEKDCTTYSIKYIVKYDDEPKEIPVYKCK